MRLGVRVPVGLHHLLDDAEEVGHDLLLPIAQGLVLEEEEADGEAVLEVLDAEQRVDGLAEDRREAAGRSGESSASSGAALGACERAPSSAALGEEGEAARRRRPGR